MVKKGQFYAGSQLLQDLVPVLGLPLDQLNFLVCQLVGLLLAVPFRTVLSPSNTSPRIRLVIELVAGIALTVFCFGHQIWYLFGQSLISYLLMKFGSPKWAQIAVFVYCMGYLSVAHISRQYLDYGGYTLDITGPLMIQTQKLTSLAFSLADGHKPEKELSDDQKSLAIKSVPDLLSFYSYLFYFHGIMCGPLSFFSDYMSFIDGSDVKAASVSSSKKSPEDSQHLSDFEKFLQNVPLVPKKLLIALAAGGLMVALPSVLCPAEGMLEEAFFEKTLLQKTWYILVCMTVARQKYYFAWTLGEALNLAAGFGFSGYDQWGRAKWDLMENVSIWDVEFATSLKVNIDGWNKRTLVWLRRVVYDRAPKYPTFAVFAVSAFWHGFYPGYYLTFGTAALFTIAARLIRRNVRGYFQTSKTMKLVYDTITFTFSRLANMYITFPFLTLELMPSLRVYAAQYFWMHIAAAAVIVYFTVIAPSATPSKGRSLKKD